MRGLLVAALLASTVACSGSDIDDLTVFAASSLTDVLPDLAAEYENQTGTTITTVFGGSNHLAAQLRDGAPADAFLTADARLLEQVSTRERPVRFAANRLVVAVPTGNPAGVSSLADLARSDLRVVVCAETVPCGAATSEMNTTIDADSHEISVRAVLSRLSLGEADVGIVYATDVASEPGAQPAWPQPEACPCVTYTAGARTYWALPFLAFLASPAAQEILVRHGFATGELD
ncbi:MAG TPA: molybdate ABC transporter substrate-binding protein [Acidimicrobiales bacterium]|nr:molybdate ABC transporter substrate-binding protein [Acidimicrobiales bacterium]